MSSDTRDRIKQILRDCCAGNASLATDILAEEFVIIPREWLPPVNLSEHGNGLVTALAQESYQPCLKLDDEVNDGGWSRSIAYANLAIAEAIEGRWSALSKRRDELATEFSNIAGAKYEGCSLATQRAIDRVIKLESAA